MISSYKRPPIIEAVIELRVEGSIGRQVIDKLKGRFDEAYPFSEANQMLDVMVGDGTTRVHQQFQGYKMNSVDGADVVMVTQNNLATIRNSPYQGWESLIQRAQENWEIWKRVVGYRKLIRLGVRYINRIDIPNPEGEALDVQKYMNYYPSFPNLSGNAMRSFTMNVVVPLGFDECHLVLNGGSVPSPLVKTASFVVDLDIGRDNPPQRDQDLWELAARIRAYKNQVFEASITEQARQLFS
jgi:uncharacterized protein (TIGR04255 family)